MGLRVVGLRVVGLRVVGFWVVGLWVVGLRVAGPPSGTSPLGRPRVTVLTAYSVIKGRVEFSLFKDNVGGQGGHLDMGIFLSTLPKFLDRAGALGGAPPKLHCVTPFY